MKAPMTPTQRKAGYPPRLAPSRISSLDQKPASGNSPANAAEPTMNVQKVVDGLANGAGFTAEEGGGLLRYIQTGRVQQYAAVLFGAAGIFALVLVLTTA